MYGDKIGPCSCECNSGQFCGGCGHVGCGMAARMRGHSYPSYNSARREAEVSDSELRRAVEQAHDAFGYSGPAGAEMWLRNLYKLLQRRYG